jgi:hypothetical protein
MKTKISKNKAFLSDVIITAVEGGIGYWSSVSKYRHGYSDGLDDDNRQPATALVHVEDSDGTPAGSLPLTTTAVAKAFRLICDKSVDNLSINPEWRTRMVAAYWAKDSCDIDAEDADQIVQIALLGDVVYG